MTTCDECYGVGCEVCNNLGWITNMRLHYAEKTEKIITPADIELALAHHRTLNEHGSPYWASLEMAQFEHHRVIKMLIGDKHIDGTQEREIVTREYFIDETGKADYRITVHP